jgi:chromosome transmission fidelity protein 4
VWNSIGIVRCYNTEDENSIDVEFHDTSLHHALHINNFLKHTMATLTDAVLVLACEIQDEAPRYICEVLLSGTGLTYPLC